MKKLFSSVIALSFTLAACSTHQANLQYSEFSDRMLLKPDAIAGQDLGPVTGEHGGAVWDECTEKARSSVTRMIEAAKAKGANAIGNIKWYASGNATPTCKKGWGYFVIWPFVLTPLFMSTRVDGTAYKTDAAKAKKAGLMMVPTNQAELEAFVDNVMAM
jgi:hypothetical protein